MIGKQTGIGYDPVQGIRLAQSTVSEHPRIPRAAGITTGVIERPRVCYSPNPVSLLPMHQLLNVVAAGSALGKAQHCADRQSNDSH